MYYLKLVALKIIFPFKYIYWSSKEVFLGVKSNLNTWRDLYNHYYLFFLILILILPWLTKKIGISIILNIICYVSFIILLKDKYELSKEKSLEYERISKDLISLLESIDVYLTKNNIKHISKKKVHSLILPETISYRDYNHFDDSKYKIILKVIDYFVSPLYSESKIIYCIKYLVIAETQTKYRKKYITEYFHSHHISNNTSNEYFLLSILANKYKKNVINFQILKKVAKEEIEDIASYEFGNKIKRTNVEKLLSDKEKYKKMKDLLIDGINKGLISESSLDSITKNNNNLFVLIKYGEGTGEPDWPANEKAPLGQILYNNNFRNPFYHENFTFIRDLERYPIKVSPNAFINNLLDKLRIKYKELKNHYPNSTVIKDGPHYEIVSFLADRKTFSWSLSETRSFNSFMSKILLDDVLNGEYNEDFIKANYYKIKKIINEMEWFSLITNEKLINDIKKNIVNIENNLLNNNISLKNIEDITKLSDENILDIATILFKLFKTKKYSKKSGNKKEKVSYFKRVLNHIKKIAYNYTSIINDLDK